MGVSTVISTGRGAAYKVQQGFQAGRIINTKTQYRDVGSCCKDDNKNIVFEPEQYIIITRAVCRVMLYLL